MRWPLSSLIKVKKSSIQIFIGIIVLTGTFPVGDPAVSSGFVSNATRVSFSTFNVQWSIYMERMGWAYYSRSAIDFGKTPDYLMCVTTETNLAAIDANDLSWNYRGRPGVNVRALIESQIKK